MALLLMFGGDLADDLLEWLAWRDVAAAMLSSPLA
jgi:hypothetical protein